MPIIRPRSTLKGALLLVACAVSACTGDDGASEPAPSNDAAALDATPAEADMIADGGAPDLAPDATPDAELARVQLQNVLEIGRCENARRIYPALPDEVGHWALERLTPTDTPTLVDGIVYQMFGVDEEEGPFCRSGLPHRVFALVAPEGPPPEGPSDTDDYRTFEITLPESPLEAADVPFDPPFVLDEGDALFVGVEMAAEADTSLCIAACRPLGGALRNRSYWSNATAEPYPWGDLVVDFGLSENFTIRAYGRAPR